MKELKAPPHLSRQSKAWWRDIVTGYELDSHHLKLLEGAAGQWDRAVSAREQIDADGATTMDRWGQAKAHPAVEIERQALTLFARLVRELALDVDAPGDIGRPPSIGTNAGRKR
jgi:phage terminase small subunit